MRRATAVILATVAFCASGQPIGAQAITPPRPILYVSDLNAAVLHAVLADGRNTTLPGWDRGMSLPVWAPTGTLWAYARADEQTQTMSLEVRGWNSRSRTLFAPEDEAFSGHVIAWAPDGARIATLVYRETPPGEALAVFDVPSAKLAARIALPIDAIDPQGENVSIRWSPEGNRILVVDRMALAIDPARGTVDTLAADVITAQWARGGDAIYYFARVPGDTTTLAPPPLGAFYYRRLDASTPIKLLTREQVAGLGLKPWDPQLTWTASPSGAKLVVWSPTFDVLSSNDGSSRPDTCVVWLHDLSNAEPVALEHPARTVRIPDWHIIRPVEWSPDERSVAMLGIAVKNNEFAIWLLDAEAGTWRSITQVDLGEGGEEFYLMTKARVMSWTQ